MGDTHTTSMKLSRNGVQLFKKHSHQNGLITQMEPLFTLKNGDFDDTNTPGSTSTNSTKSNVFVSSLSCIESRSRLKAGEAYEQHGTTATVSVLADQEATLSCTAHREPVAPAFELTYIKPVSIVSTCTINTNPNLSQNEIASPNYPALVSKFGVEHSKSLHTNSHPAAAATYVLQSVDETKCTRALSSNQQLDITHSSPLTAELDVSGRGGGIIDLLSVTHTC
ncbi:unnamed protein product [Dicrocoelium dendriticum]|nr:unnamed protein product [Dicrocoelium dendriticum]